ncbi:MAG: hypothetical protein L3J18_05405 [Candidatus Brocadia sp.]|nr:MAG: hypothetical protein L3J18_05405 [Candidatus Brocadia sp.]
MASKRVILSMTSLLHVIARALARSNPKAEEEGLLQSSLLRNDSMLRS